MSKESLRERLAKKREELKKRGSGGNRNLIFIQEGTLRVRVLPVGPDADFGHEIDHYYLGQEIKGVISPTSVGMDCPIAEKRKELLESKNPGDVALAEKLTARKKYLIPVMVYEDELGKTVDDEDSGKLVLITGGLYGKMIDFFLDPELGDFTDPDDGYDLKIKRTGKGKMDTEYDVHAMRPSVTPEPWDEEINFEELVKTVIPTYDEAEDILATFLASNTDGDDDEKPAGDMGSARKSRRRKK